MRPRTAASVMAGLVPAVHAKLRARNDVDARDKPGHDDRVKGGDFPLTT
jgi:hypothetical protein